MSTQDRLRSLGIHQAAVPPQDRARGDQATAPQRSGQPPDQGGEDGPIGPVQSRPRVSSAEYRDLVPQDEQLDVFGRCCTAEQRQPVEDLVEDQIEQAERRPRDPACAVDR
jgi:hypothetical protein